MFGYGFDFFAKNHIPAETRVHGGENAKKRILICPLATEKLTNELFAKLHFFCNISI